MIEVERTAEWSSIHGRGVGRPLDTVATAGIGRDPYLTGLCDGWEVFPHRVVAKAHRLLRLPVHFQPKAAPTDAGVLDAASHGFHAEPSRQCDLIGLGYAEKRGRSAAETLRL